MVRWRNDCFGPSRKEIVPLTAAGSPLVIHRESSVVGMPGSLDARS
jgi:hypothetical protein